MKAAERRGVGAAAPAASGRAAVAAAAPVGPDATAGPSVVLSARVNPPVVPVVPAGPPPLTLADLQAFKACLETRPDYDFHEIRELISVRSLPH